MEAIFKKYFWVVKLVGIAAASGLAASAVATQLGTSMALSVAGSSEDEEGEEGEEGEEDEEDEDSPNPFATKRSSLGGAGRSVATAKRKTADEIQARNIFCPTCVPEDAPVIVPGQADAGTPGLRPGEVKTTLPLRLMATMEATDPQYSLATVYDGDAGITGLYGVEDEIRPGVLVVGIDSGVLHIRNNAAFEYVQMGEVEQARPSRSRDKKDDDKDKKPRRKKNSRAIDGAEESINCPNDNLCIVERQFVEKLMGNPALLAKQARIVPSQKNGETQGFKFYGIRRGSLPRLLGLKNGDMLTEVNGESLNSMDQAMGLVMKLRRASNVTVTLVRKGKTINKEIQIQ